MFSCLNILCLFFLTLLLQMLVSAPNERFGVEQRRVGEKEVDVVSKL